MKAKMNVLSLFDGISCGIRNMADLESAVRKKRERNVKKCIDTLM